MFKAYVELTNGEEIVSTRVGTSEEMVELASRMASSCLRNGLDVLTFGTKKIS